MAYLIALDDGHGMSTPGKRTPYIAEIGKFIHENEFNRAVVKYLDAELKRCGFRTLLTAPTDVDTPLSTRVNTANAAEADAFVSIHYNALDGKFDGEGKDPEGCSIHIYPGHRTKGAGKLATAIGNHLKGGTAQKYRGVIEQDLYVTRETHMVAILSENGFMDNKREALLMINPDFQKEVAVEHAKGICEYFNVKYVPEPAPKPTPAPAPAATPKTELDEAIEFLRAAGISDGSNPQETITAGRVMIMLYRALKPKEVK